jgi:hypothetical protein
VLRMCSQVGSEGRSLDTITGMTQAPLSAEPPPAFTHIEGRASADPPPFSHFDVLPVTDPWEAATEYQLRRIANALERIADFLDRIQIPQWLTKKK